ncbi:trypsin beta-like [Arctopsyche grandis]|uniref:trypsin beta-like n=1 Tax=Arctopsyche grandis TaxID=121162 RepID=UPI00406D99B0
MLHFFEMFRFVVVLTLLVLANGDPLQRNHTRLAKHSGRIVGGQEAKIEQRPYQVSLITTDADDTNYLCGGSILSRRWILTAAHCLEGIKAVEVRAGSDHFAVGGFTVKTMKYKIHPQYNSATKDYDIAVLDLMTNILPINNKTIKAVALAPSGTNLPNGTAVTVSGFGTTREGGQVSETLMEVTINIVDRATCQKAYNTITSRMICAGVTGGGKDSCQGDSGGPLVRDSDNIQVGVVSFGIGCARKDYPGVYSNVSNLRSWIKSNTGV